MNVYDEAHNLERAIKESEEFKQYDAARKKVEANPELKKMLDDFMQRSIELQAKQMAGEELTQEMMQAAQQMSAIVMSDPLAAEFMQCEMRFSLMMQDVFNIISEAIDMKMPGK